MRSRSSFILKILCLGLIGLILAGCGSSPPPAPSPAPSPVLTQKSDPNPTAQPSPLPQAAGPCQPIQSASAGEWVPVADTQTGYHFEVPSTWTRDTATQSSVILFYSDPVHANQTELTGGLCGLVKLEVIIDSIGSWIGWVPDPDMQQILVGGLPAFRADVNTPQSNGQEVKTTSVYFSAGKYFYSLSATYLPPQGASPETAGQFQSAAEAIFEKILKSLQVQIIPA